MKAEYDLIIFQVTWLSVLILLPPLCWETSSLQGIGQQSQCEGGRLASQTPPCNIQVMLIVVVDRQSVIIDFNICFIALLKYIFQASSGHRGAMNPALKPKELETSSYLSLKLRRSKKRVT